MNKSLKFQKGMTLMELLVAGFISIIASTGMVILMSNTLGTGARTIQAARLADEMRSSMQFITRELRRANYHASFSACFGDSDCANTLDIDDYIYSLTDPVTGVADLTKGIGIDDTQFDANDCLWFWYDRNSDQVLSDEPVGAFRRAENDDGVGIVQMTILHKTAPNCRALWNDDSWIDVTDVNIVDVTTLEIDNSVATSTAYDTTILDSFLEAGAVDSYLYTLSGSTQAVDRIGITMTGSLISAAAPTWMQDDDAPTIVLQDFIRIRNSTVSIAP